MLYEYSLCSHRLPKGCRPETRFFPDELKAGKHMTFGWLPKYHLSCELVVWVRGMTMDESRRWIPHFELALRARYGKDSLTAVHVTTVLDLYHWSPLATGGGSEHHPLPRRIWRHPHGLRPSSLVPRGAFKMHERGDMNDRHGDLQCIVWVRFQQAWQVDAVLRDLVPAEESGAPPQLSPELFCWSLSKSMAEETQKTCFKDDRPVHAARPGTPWPSNMYHLGHFAMPRAF